MKKCQYVLQSEKQYKGNTKHIYIFKSRKSIDSKIKISVSSDDEETLEYPYVQMHYYYFTQYFQSSKKLTI